MRTTIDLDDKLYWEIKRRADSSNRTIRDVVQSALITAFYPERRSSKRFKVVAHNSSFRPGIDQHRLSDIAQDLETEEFSAKFTLPKNTTNDPS